VVTGFLAGVKAGKTLYFRWCRVRRGPPLDRIPAAGNRPAITRACAGAEVVAETVTSVGTCRKLWRTSESGHWCC
jgi:hypothetical protein